jgi:signal transduction histidine kinase
LGVLEYLLIGIGVKNIYLIAIVMICLVTLAGVMISKLAIDPLQEHVTNLQNLSKETLHELNLPISTIKTNVQMMQKNLKEEKEQKRLSRIEKACEMLYERYNELDYMIKMQSQQNLQEVFDLQDLVLKRVEFLKLVYPRVDFILTLQSLMIKSDKKGLSKVIDNLIDNGVKYSSKSNKIEINITGSTFFIKDFGCGMDEVQLLRIFDNYYQCNKNMQGFGIGLAMVKRFCDKETIGLNFKSNTNEGTTVSLQFQPIKEG